MTNISPGRPIPSEAIYADTISDKQFATTLARGLEVLRCFTPQVPILGNKELSELTGLPKATISRFTYTLTRLGLLRPAPHQAKYQLGSAVLTLGYPLLATMYIRQFARPAMSELANEVGGSVAMGIRERLNIVYVETCRGRSPSSPPYTEIGYAHPILATSIGRAYLAGSEPTTREAIINEIRVKAPEAWAQHGEKVESALKDFRRLGFCISVDCFRPGIYGVGVPLHRLVDGQLIVLNCAVYADRVPAEELETSVGPKLLSVSRGLDNSILG